MRSTLVIQVKEVGIVLGHGSNAADWNGKFLTELAAALASEGDIIASGTSTVMPEGCMHALLHFVSMVSASCIYMTVLVNHGPYLVSAVT